MRRAFFVAAILAGCAFIVLGAAKGVGYEPPSPADIPKPQESAADLVQASVEALEALPIKTVRESHRRILVALLEGPMTDAELLAATQVHPNALRARRGELVEAGLVVQAGSKRQENWRKVCLWGLP